MWRIIAMACCHLLIFSQTPMAALQHTVLGVRPSFDMKRIRSKARGQRLAQLIELLQNTMPWEMLEMLGIRKANHAEQQKMEN
jgi:hypothetical protein